MVERKFLRYRFVSATGKFVDMIDLTKVTSNASRALMVNQEQVDNCLKRYPELKGFKVQEVVKSNSQVLR